MSTVLAQERQSNEALGMREVGGFYCLIQANGAGNNTAAGLKPSVA